MKARHRIRNRIRIRKCFSAIILTVLIAGSLCELPGTAEALAQKEEILFQDLPMVVAATRHEKLIGEAPAAVTVITREEIKRYGYRTLAEAVRSATGFNGYYDREYEYAGVRGFGRPGDYNSRILVMVDGHALNEIIFASSPFGLDCGIDLDLVERIEIVRGPGSALYGSNAFFAVVNLVTVPGGRLNGLLARADAGTNDTYAGLLAYGDRYGDEGEWLAAASAYDSAGARRLYFSEFDDPATNNGVAENLDGARRQAYFSKVLLGEFTLAAGLNNARKKFPTGNFEVVFNDPRAENVDQRGFLNLKYAPEPVDGRQVMARLSYDLYRYEGYFPYDYPPVAVNRDLAAADWAGGEAQFCWEPAENNRLTVGMEYHNNFRLNMQNFTELPPRVVNLDFSQKETRWSYYLQNEFKAPLLGLTLGVRSDNYPGFGEAVNPRLGAVFNPAGDSYVKLLYGRAFRAPSAYERYYHDGYNTTKPNEALRPETVNSYELVYEQGKPREFYLLCSVYRNQINDLIDQTVDPADGLLQFRNLSRVRATGVDLTVRKEWAAGFSGRLGLGYVRAVDDTSGMVLSNSPEKSAAASLAYRLSDSRTALGLTLTYLDQRRTVGGAWAPQYLLTDLNVTTDDHWGATIALKVRNLFDVQYADPAAETNYPLDAIARDGRSFLLSLSKKI